MQSQAVAGGRENRRVAVARASSWTCRGADPRPGWNGGSAMRMIGAAAAALTAILLGAPSVALAQANCRNTGSFEAWLADFKKEALAKRISPAAIAAASPYLVFDQRIINIDRGQRFFAQDFLEISDRMLTRSGRLTSGPPQ